MIVFLVLLLKEQFYEIMYSFTKFVAERFLAKSAKAKSSKPVIHRDPPSLKNRSF
jgi:hypothetical protein